MKKLLLLLSILFITLCLSAQDDIYYSPKPDTTHKLSNYEKYRLEKDRQTSKADTTKKVDTSIVNTTQPTVVNNYYYSDNTDYYPYHYVYFYNPYLFYMDFCIFPYYYYHPYYYYGYYGYKGGFYHHDYKYHNREYIPDRRNSYVNKPSIIRTNITTSRSTYQPTYNRTTNIVKPSYNNSTNNYHPTVNNHINNSYHGSHISIGRRR